MKKRLKLKSAKFFLILVLCITIIIVLCIFIMFLSSNKDIERPSASILEEQPYYIDYTSDDRGAGTIKENIDFSLSINDLSLKIGEDKKINFIISIEDEHDINDKKRIMQSIYGNIIYEIEDNSILKIENDSIIALKDGTTKVIASIYNDIPKERCDNDKCSVIKHIETEFKVTVF